MTGKNQTSGTDKTLKVISDLVNSGITKICLILRHGARNHHQDAVMDPFMGLTDSGKTEAFNLGTALPASLIPKLFSSCISRCVETAYLVDKGYTQSHGATLDPVVVQEYLGPFYIKDSNAAITTAREQGVKRFIHNWFKGNISRAIMADAKKSADLLYNFIENQLHALNDNQIAICISHDWHILLLKRYHLKLFGEIAEDVAYLDGVILFKNKDRICVTRPFTRPISI